MHFFLTANILILIYCDGHISISHRKSTVSYGIVLYCILTIIGDEMCQWSHSTLHPYYASNYIHITRHKLTAYSPEGYSSSWRRQLWLFSLIHGWNSRLSLHGFRAAKHTALNRDSRCNARPIMISNDSRSMSAQWCYSLMFTTMENQIDIPGAMWSDKGLWRRMNNTSRITRSYFPKFPSSHVNSSFFRLLPREIPPKNDYY